MPLDAADAIYAVLSRGIATRDTRLVAASERRRIVAGVDGSPASDAALAWACEEARLREAPVVALHVVVIPYDLPRIPVDVPVIDLDREGKQILDEALARAPTAGVSIEPQLLEGSPGELLVEASDDAALIVVGTRAHGRLASFVIGSVTSTVLHHANCAVVVVRA